MNTLHNMDFNALVSLMARTTAKYEFVSDKYEAANGDYKRRTVLFDSLMVHMDLRSDIVDAMFRFRRSGDKDSLNYYRAKRFVDTMKHI